MADDLKEHQRRARQNAEKTLFWQRVQCSSLSFGGLRGGAGDDDGERKL